MARIRTIKPEHWNDKALTEISLQAHLLWIALWNFADDEGVFEDDINLIKSQVFPRRTDIRLEQIKDWLGQLSKARFVIPFSHNNESYYIHRTFKAHQRIDKPRPSKVPSNIIQGLIQDQYKNDIVSVAPYSIVKEGKGESSAREKFIPDLHVDNPPPQTAIELKNLLMANEKWVCDIQMTHRGKNLEQAILESWNHPPDIRKKNMGLDDWKKLVNTWLSNSKIKTDQAHPAKRKSAIGPVLQSIYES